MSTGAIRANYSRVATAYAGTWADTLAVHGQALANRLPLAEQSVSRVALRTAGFGGVEITVERFRHQPTAREFLTHSQVVGAMARRIDQLPADRRTACLAAAERELSRLGAEAFIEAGTVLYATATAA